GWPVGRLSLLAGSRGSGKRTLAQQSVAHATREGATVYIDFPGRLDPEFLTRLGADLDRLLIVRPRSIREAMESAGVLARAGGARPADAPHPHISRPMILCVRIPTPAVVAAWRSHPELRGRPLVLGGLAHERGSVQAASAEARAMGVVEGMALSQAEQCCPEA